VNTRQASFWACYFSVRKLFPDLETRTLWDADALADETCKLWTFTFPDAETRADPQKAMKRWPPLAQWIRDQGWRCVRVLERGELGAWHIHAVTPEFWPVRKVRAAAERFGFGRVNVKPIPSVRAPYVAKYVGKNLHGDVRGIRRWGCIGFKGFGVTDIEIVKKTRILVERAYDPVLYSRLIWAVDGTPLHVARLRPVVQGQPDDAKIMNIKPHWLPVIHAQLTSGKIVMLGEYRGCEAITKQVNAYEGGKVVGKVSRVIVTHHVEDPQGKSFDFRESVPDANNRPNGTDARGDIKPPASRGDVVLVHVTNMSDKWGHDTGGIICLSGVGDNSDADTKAKK